jgi:Bacterial archaeo-eukaryotic release factor family 3
MTANLKANVHATGKHKNVPVFQRLQPLLGEHTPPCLSVYQPTYRAFPDSQQNRVQYRNLLKELKTALDQRPGAAHHELLEPFERLVDDEAFWAHPQDGLAVFGAPGFFHVEKVQRPVPRLVVVNEHLFIKPLVRVFQSEDRYQVLALDRKEIKLYQGDRYALDEIVLAPSVPRTIDDALGPNVHVQGVDRTAPFAAGRGGQAAFAHHGHGSKLDETRIDIERFFRVIDRAITEAHSKPSGLPLILAALPEYHAHFREISHNALLLDESIALNADALTRDQLREAAWRIMEPRYHARLQQLLDAYHAAKARGLATDDLTHALEFATDGRVGTLLVESDRRIPGHVEGRMPRLASADEPGVGDILDDLAERVLRTGGQAIVAPKGSMPTSTGLAAVFRY